MRIGLIFLCLCLALAYNFAALSFPNPYDRPKQPNGYYVPSLDTIREHQHLAPSELPPVPTDSQTEYTLDGKYIPLSNALNHQTFDKVPLLTDMLKPQTDKTMSAAAQANLLDLNGAKMRFKVLQFKNKGVTFNALKVAENTDSFAEEAYWVAQGGHVDVPLHPTPNDPKIVLTPLFTGCTFVLDLLADGKTVRIYHVQGGKEQNEYNSKDHGLGMLGAMEYKHYGYHLNKEQTKYIENTSATAFVQWTGMWVIKYQKIVDKPGIGAVEFKSGGATVSKTRCPQSSRAVGYGEICCEVGCNGRPIHRKKNVDGDFF